MVALEAFAGSSHARSYILQENRIDIVFVIGGDGTHKAAVDLQVCVPCSSGM
jgi:predicted polyphosphate/ATP-dependent NAD kinase